MALATMAVRYEEIYHARMFAAFLDNEIVSGLDSIQHHASDHPGYAALTIDMLNRFADGDPDVELPKLCAKFRNGAWQVALVELVAWWSEMQQGIAELWRPCGEDVPPVPGLTEAKRAEDAARESLGSIIAFSFENDGDEGIREFLRAYRIWTRAVCEMGRKGWPGIDWSNLEKVV